MCAPVIERVQMPIHIRHAYRRSGHVEVPHLAHCDGVRATDSCKHPMARDGCTGGGCRRATCRQAEQAQMSATAQDDTDTLRDRPGASLRFLASSYLRH